MLLVIEPERIPLTPNRDGVVLVTDTRVSLDLIVAAFVAGATAEEIAQKYSSVSLADVYAVLTYYLRHRDAVEAYLDLRSEQRGRVRAENERRLDPQGIRDRLLARRQATT